MAGAGRYPPMARRAPGGACSCRGRGIRSWSIQLSLRPGAPKFGDSWDATRLRLRRCARPDLMQCPVQLQSELDEQGLQIAALSLGGPPLVVTTAEVTICSPF